MLKLVDEPWKILSRLCRKNKIKRADILTGFIGSGACSALARLGVRARIILGLPSAFAALSAAQIEELARLCKLHEVRWLPGLHAKLYLLDERITMVGSANLTRAGFERLDEILLATDDKGTALSATKAFKLRWAKAQPLKLSKLTVLPAQKLSGTGDSLDAGLGIAREGVVSGFSSVTARSSKKSIAAHGPSSHAVRLIASWPQWIDELEDSETTTWSTSHLAPLGQVHLFAITKTGKGLKDHLGDARVDAINSIWRLSERPHTVDGSRWPIQAGFQRMLTLDHPVPKEDLIEAKLLKRNWPQSTRGQLFQGRGLKTLVELLVARNPKSQEHIRAALLPD